MICFVRNGKKEEVRFCRGESGAKMLKLDRFA